MHPVGGENMEANNVYGSRCLKLNIKIGSNGALRSKKSAGTSIVNTLVVSVNRLWISEARIWEDMCESLLDLQFASCGSSANRRIIRLG